MQFCHELPSLLEQERQANLVLRIGFHMPNILVVDDSAIDRKLVGALLEKVPNWRVEYSRDGDEALAQLPLSDIDAIVTDLRMPGRNGLELVIEVKKQYPWIPLVLITSEGSEDIAIEALRAGAASYSPKRLLSKDLVATVHKVLEANGAQRGQQRIVERLVSGNLRFRLENRRDLVGPMVELIQSYLGGWDQSERLRIGVAVDEAIVNAMYHGNLEISSEFREGDGKRFDDEIVRRSAIDPYHNRAIVVELRFTNEELVVSIEDEGPGFDPGDLPDPTDPENLEKVSGRGLLLIRTFMDSVSFNDRGNRIEMSRTRPSVKV